MKTQLGHYAIVSELGRGGMGVVYKGYEASLNRYVAIKVLADSLAHDASVKERFLREARSMAALNDTHIIQIYFIGDDDGQTYFVMEFVDGESLGSVLKREGKLKPEQAAKIIFQTAQGLSTAHERGVITSCQAVQVLRALLLQHDPRAQALLFESQAGIDRRYVVRQDSQLGPTFRFDRAAVDS